MLDRYLVPQEVSALVDARARLGCTRIGSPGIFGYSAPLALYPPAQSQVCD